MPRAFVIRPFNVKRDSAGNSFDFELVHERLIEPALKACSLAGSTTGEIVEPGNVREDMFALLVEADLVVCDITVHNANVFYELGIRHALRKKRTVMIKGAPAADSTPFDVLTDRYVPYDTGAPGQALDLLIAAIQAALSSERDTDSPIFKMLPGLPEANPATVQVLPLGFREEVDRARAAQSKGWLRLLAHEVRGLRFERVALQLVAEALWKLGDYDAARESFERVRDTAPDDEPANLALANVYERLYRTERLPQLLTASDQAVERVLALKTAGRASRVEALALKGRNCKTRWREEFAGVEDEAQRRSAAMSQMLRQSYGAYREAFRADLNHFYSGLAALQMGTIFMDLARDEGWTASFDSDGEANEYRRTVESEVGALKPVVQISLEAALKRFGPLESERIWADISRADLVFLNEDEAARVVKRYQDVIPRDNPFAWDAAKGQLVLFASLGVKARVARAVIEAMDARLATASGTVTSGAVKPTVAAARPLHIVVFSGQRFDEPGSRETRFPATLEQSALRTIQSRLSSFAETDSVVGFAAAEPGADILFHEACRALGIPSTVCLPMPKDQYVEAVAPTREWRSRILALIREKDQIAPPTVLELSDAPGLPRWLQGSDMDAWQRANRWLLEMAVTLGAPRVTLLSVWDERDDSADRRGTPHMVRLAQARAGVDILVIPTKSLEGPETTSASQSPAAPTPAGPPPSERPR
jgi:hypothetical protein